MDTVCVLPGWPSGHSRTWPLSTCSEAGAAEEPALKMEQPRLGGAGWSVLEGVGHPSGNRDTGALLHLLLLLLLPGEGRVDVS